MSDLRTPDAKRIAEEYLRNLYQGDESVVVMDESTREEPFGWIFFYQSAAFVESGDSAKALIGNAPIVVDREGRIHSTGTGRPLEEYLRRFRDSSSDN